MSRQRAPEADLRSHQALRPAPSLSCEQGSGKSSLLDLLVARRARHERLARIRAEQLHNVVALYGDTTETLYVLFTHTPGKGFSVTTHPKADRLQPWVVEYLNDVAAEANSLLAESTASSPVFLGARDLHELTAAAAHAASVLLAEVFVEDNERILSIWVYLDEHDTPPDISQEGTRHLLFDAHHPLSLDRNDSLPSSFPSTAVEPAVHLSPQQTGDARRVSGEGRTSGLRKGDPMDQTRDLLTRAQDALETIRSAEETIRAAKETIRSAEETIRAATTSPAVRKRRTSLLRPILRLTTQLLAVDLRRVREDLGLSRRQVGRLVGVPTTTVTGWERPTDRPEPRLRSLTAVASALTSYAAEHGKDSAELRRLSNLITLAQHIDVRVIRAASGLNRTQFGQLVGSAGHTVAAWEDRRAEPRLSTLKLVCERLLSS